MLNVPETDPPWRTVRLEKNSERLKLAKGWTVSEAVALEVRLPLVAWKVKV